MMNNQNKKIQKKDACSNCIRPQSQCICDRIKPVLPKLDILILQHPQEKFKLLNSARLTEIALEGAVLRTGLSWPNIHRAAGKQITPAKWAVLYLGPAHQLGSQPVQILNRKMTPLEGQMQLEGIIALDGSWKQAKALWWRNPWLLKLKRIQLNPSQSSLRRQAKDAGLSTAEAVAMVLAHAGQQQAAEYLMDSYHELIIKPNL